MFFISGFSLIYINVNIIIVCTPAFLLGVGGAWQDLNFVFFPVLTKNSNWQILTKNLVTFKR